MKITIKELRKLVNESAYLPVDLPTGVYVGIEDTGGREFNVFYSDIDGFVLNSSEIKGVVEVGEPTLGDCDGALEIIRSTATKGWGPLLYDVAIEVASTRASGLVSDREKTSPAATRVWEYYLNRPDVKSHKLSDAHAHKSSTSPALGYRFTKSPSMLSLLKIIGKLI